ncbi:DUF1129 family protein [Carnobacteriaceae bacterium zg-ZUI252]|nr:DUF1129 family protein [Carnobacteriaceae bacterium zg-ZUI252]MBS4769995.1 DUF1129 family protein [Carnobacteriaceae bacterium zg-ZUI240]QTU83219.1 DUF1129 family protein [Carnobacteriaceae bacterium zg-C25]
MSKHNEEMKIDYATVNVELYKQLNKRNQQYIYDLDKALQAANVASLQRHSVKHDMMQELITAQKQGATARQIYGTVSQQVAAILSGPKEDFSKPSPDLHLFIDGALMIGAMFMVITGISSQSSFGIVSLLLNFFFGGFAMLIITKSSPKYLGITNFRNNKFLIRYIGMTALAMFVWVIGMGLMGLVPQAINPVLDGTVYIVLGVVIIALRFYLKRKLNIRGTIF